ncbi:hypothetical protein L083_6379 [Actinoplanes sp. N902-109]|nr:hypothetical protein L083_6379 [Actinoplanes sp. N902-109]
MPRQPSLSRMPAPIAMPVRLFNGEAAAWEPLISLVVLDAVRG